jgi:hypothetical protein
VSFDESVLKLLNSTGLMNIAYNEKTFDDYGVDINKHMPSQASIDDLTQDLKHFATYGVPYELLVEHKEEYRQSNLSSKQNAANQGMVSCRLMLI